MKENKEGIVVQLSESTDWEEQKPFPSRSASSIEALSASEELVARKQMIKKELRLSEKIIQGSLLGPLLWFRTVRAGGGRNAFQTNWLCEVELIGQTFKWWCRSG